MEPLSPLDASFLDVEDEVSHMHIGSTTYGAPRCPHRAARRSCGRWWAV